jgi:Rv0078B-related antitoxin
MSGANRSAEALRTAIDLFETGLAMMRQNLRREYPEATEQELGVRLRGWLHHRPGAEFGDCPGRIVDFDAERG